MLWVRMSPTGCPAEENPMVELTHHAIQGHKSWTVKLILENHGHVGGGLPAGGWMDSAVEWCSKLGVFVNMKQTSQLLKMPSQPKLSKREYSPKTFGSVNLRHATLNLHRQPPELLASLLPSLSP